MRNSPTIYRSKRYYDCAFLVSGYDTLEESASVFIFSGTWERLEAAKKYAQERNNGSNQAYTTRIGEMEFQIKPHGGNGVSFILSNNLFTVAIRPANTLFNISVTYRSRTLWEYGANRARNMIWDVLLKEMKPRPVEQQTSNADLTGWRRVSRVDYAMDFHSPEFTQEIGADMLDRIVCHSSCKVRWDFKAEMDEEESGEPELETQDGYAMGTSNRIQTLTIGKKNSLQVQIYNKSDEITEKSQKTWMYKLWRKIGLAPENGQYNDVWRIELRFGRDYLGARGIDDFEQLEANKEALIGEALKTRRLTDKTNDKNRRRWPIHPIWEQAIDMSGNSQVMIDLNNHKEQAAEIIIEKIQQDIKAALRRYSVLETGGDVYDQKRVENMLLNIMKTIENDTNHEDKMEEYGEKYKYISAPI